MKKTNVFLVVSMLVLSVMAQDSNEVRAVSQSPGSDQVNQPTNQFRPWQKNKTYPDQKKQSEKKHAKDKQRRIQLMERELNRIGVTEEEKAQIIELQKTYKEKMLASAKRITMAREKLSKLQDEGAPMEVLEAAILDVSAAQTEQLRILVRNRIEMERILGREKHALFMQNARTQYRKHGHRGGPPLPPRPGMPPIPGQRPVPPKTPPTPENATPENP